MTWREMDDFLGGYRGMFPSPQSTLRAWEQPGCVFELLERQTSESLDAAIREFAKTRVWPPLTDDQKAILGFRLDFAWHIAAALSDASQPERMFPTSQLSDREQLEWILVEAWGWPGSPYWQNLVGSLLGKDSSGLQEIVDDNEN